MGVAHIGRSVGRSCGRRAARRNSLRPKEIRLLGKRGAFAPPISCHVPQAFPRSMDCKSRHRGWEADMTKQGSMSVAQSLGRAVLGAFAGMCLGVYIGTPIVAGLLKVVPDQYYI